MLSLPVWCKCCCLHFCYRAVLPATRQPCLVVVALRMGYVQTRRTFEKEAGLAGLWCMPLIPLLRRQRPKKEKKKNKQTKKQRTKTNHKTKQQTYEQARNKKKRKLQAWRSCVFLTEEGRVDGRMANGFHWAQTGPSGEWRLNFIIQIGFILFWLVEI